MQPKKQKQVKDPNNQFEYNGEIYPGNIMRHGYGEQVWNFDDKSKHEYKGQWHLDKVGGDNSGNAQDTQNKFTVTDKDGKMLKKYEGQCKDGIAEGKGKFTKLIEFSNKKGEQEEKEVYYKGQWKDNKPHGTGEESWYDHTGGKHMYEGQYQEGKKHGQGKYKYPNGTYYFGEFKNDSINGRGKMTWPNSGNNFDGIWQDGQMKEGRFKWGNGSWYEGPFKNNLRDGHGTYDWGQGDGRRYVGDFKNDKFGEGVYTSRRDHLRQQAGQQKDESQVTKVYFLNGQKVKEEEYKKAKTEAKQDAAQNSQA